MDALIDDTLETLTLMFTELVQTARALPRPELTSEDRTSAALISRARVIVAIIAVGVALRRMSPRPKPAANPAGAMTQLMAQVGTAAK